MPDQETFNGLTIGDIEDATILMTPAVAGAIGELIVAYREALATLEQERARIELLRAAARGEP